MSGRYAALALERFQKASILSFDAMIHIGLHILFVYRFSASRILRPGVVLAMSVADACSELGFMKLIDNTPGVYKLRGNAGGHFMWISKGITESILPRLGFDVSFAKGNDRDLFFSAILVDPDRTFD